MPEISKITLPSGTTYDLKDTVARQSASGGITLRGVTTTALVDEATTNPIMIDGESYTAVNQDAVFYGKKEFVFDGTKWHEFGDMSGLGDLATKDNVEANYTPAGSVSTTLSTAAAASGEGNYTPEGSVSAPTISVNSAGSTTTVNSITDVGSLATYTVSGETLTITAGTLPTKGADTIVKTGDASYTASAPTFTGTEITISGSSSFSGTAATITSS